MAERPARRLAAVLSAAVLAGCGGDAPPAPPGSSAVAESAAAPDALPEVLATVDGEAIRAEDLPTGTAGAVRRLDNAYRQQRRQLIAGALDEAIATRMLDREAEADGRKPAEIVAQATGAISAPTDAEVEAFYAANRGRLQGRGLDELREEIRTFLHESRAEAAAESLDARLREKYDVVVHLEPFRFSFDHEGAPFLGPEDAAVTLVEFSDFECPYCARFHATLKRIESEYSDRVRIVYRQFPIPALHPNAFKAAEASLCAHEQGEFWAYHDLLFEEQDRLEVRDLKAKADRLGLDTGAFDDCLDTGRYVERIQADQAAGEAAGVTGTPALFVNGEPLPGGAVDYAVVARALDEALERADA